MEEFGDIIIIKAETIHAISPFSVFLVKKKYT